MCRVVLTAAQEGWEILRLNALERLSSTDHYRRNYIESSWKVLPGVERYLDYTRTFTILNKTLEHEMNTSVGNGGTKFLSGAIEMNLYFL